MGNWTKVDEGWFRSENFIIVRHGSIWRLSERSSGELIYEDTKLSECKKFAENYEDLRYKWRNFN